MSFTLSVCPVVCLPHLTIIILLMLEEVWVYFNTMMGLPGQLGRKWLWTMHRSTLRVLPRGQSSQEVVLCGVTVCLSSRVLKAIHNSQEVMVSLAQEFLRGSSSSDVYLDVNLQQTTYNELPTPVYLRVNQRRLVVFIHHLWSVHDDLYKVVCTRWSVHGGLYKVACTMWSVHGGLYNAVCTRWSVHDDLYMAACTSVCIMFRCHRDIVLYNSLAEKRVRLVRLVVDSILVSVSNENGDTIPCQINPVWTGLTEFATDKFELVFPVTMEGISLLKYGVTLSSTVSCALAEVQLANPDTHGPSASLTSMQERFGAKFPVTVNPKMSTIILGDCFHDSRI